MLAPGVDFFHYNLGSIQDDYEKVELLKSLGALSVENGEIIIY